ncbi:AUGMIN subunit 6 [Zea mays]|uniref:AUGMIN subunit 6 n=1 Tax=Zea mays TaxID=4577 RepID=A0A1D6H389_MAIZE|nr:AUGMIN subunit 6 [Zea mays]
MAAAAQGHSSGTISVFGLWRWICWG